MAEVVQQRAVFLHLPKSKKIDIEFENITYTVKNGRKGKKQILKGVCGKFKSGELTAILGPSGAGKTSLLNILTGFKNTGMQGAIRSSGSTHNRQGSGQYKKESCYILQDDNLFPLFTVDEIMSMAANLKLGQNLSDKAKQLVIDDVLETLNLTTCKKTPCCRISGGQKKRLSIALELLNNPPVMFLDEPTTGLDSSSSLQCITMLKALARGGRTIICTIHQPSATIFKMFDHVYVLADGQCIYQGDNANTVSYLSSAGFICPQYHNPADFLLEVANGDYGNHTVQLAEAAVESRWRNLLPLPKLEIEQEKRVNYENNSDIDKATVLVNPPSEWVKFWILLNRSLLQLYRDWTITHLKLALHIVVGLLLGLTYLNAGNDASKTFVNMGYFIISVVYLCYTSMMPAVLRFPSELPVLRKEKFNNWYGLKTYYIANMVANIPIQILFSCAYTSISYFMSGQPLEWTRYFMFIIPLVLLTIVAESMGLVLGTTVDSVNGTFLGAIIVCTKVLFAGFVIFLTHMSKPMYIVSFLSYARYTFEALMQAIYGNGRSPLICPEDAVYCHYKIPEILLKEIGMDEDSYLRNVLTLIGNIIFLRIVGYYTLKRKLATN